jgi:hypothetical protein
MTRFCRTFSTTTTGTQTTYEDVAEPWTLKEKLMDLFDEGSKYASTTTEMQLIHKCMRMFTTFLDGMDGIQLY